MMQLQSAVRDYISMVVVTQRVSRQVDANVSRLPSLSNSRSWQAHNEHACLHRQHHRRHDLCGKDIHPVRELQLCHRRTTRRRRPEHHHRLVKFVPRCMRLAPPNPLCVHEATPIPPSLAPAPQPNLELSAVAAPAASSTNLNHAFSQDRAIDGLHDLAIEIRSFLRAISRLTLRCCSPVPSFETCSRPVKLGSIVTLAISKLRVLSCSSAIKESWSKFPSFASAIQSLIHFSIITLCHPPSSAIEILSREQYP